MSSLPSLQQFEMYKEIGAQALGSGLIPSSVNTREKALIIILKGHELGIPPMQAFSDIAVINGKPAMSASLMVALGYKNIPGLVINYLTTTNEKCEIEVQRPGGKMMKFSFTIDDAKKANLLGKGPWTTYPAAMLRARCVSAMARAVFPDALSGVVYTPEELGADVDDEGSVIDVRLETNSRPEPPKSPEPRLAIVPTEVIEARQPNAPTPHQDPGMYLINFGQFKGKRIKDIDQFQLDGYVNYLSESAAKTGNGMNRVARELVANAEAFLKSREFNRDGGNK